MVALIAICAALALFAALAFILVAVAGERSPIEVRLAALRAQSRAVGETDVAEKPSGQDIFAVITKPLSPFRDWLKANDADLSYRLSVAGYRKPEDADTFLTLKLLAPIIGLLLATFAPAHDFFLYALILAAAGFFAPDMFLFYAINQRKAKIARALPDVLDLLVICMEAGLGIDQSVIKISGELRAAHPEMCDELVIIGNEQRAGKPRLDAWRSMADRVDLDILHQFVGMLVQTEKLGTPIARALGVFADSLRSKRLMTAEEQAAKTTVKLIFPLALFIFPALFIVLLGPAVITIMKTMEEMGR